MWQTEIKLFLKYLTIEKGYSEHTLSAYQHDIELLCIYLESELPDIKPEELVRKDFDAFARFLGKKEYSTHTQARILSGVKSFFKYLQLE